MATRVEIAREQVDRLEWFLSKARQALIDAQHGVDREERLHADAQRELAEALKEEIAKPGNRKKGR